MINLILEKTMNQMPKIFTSNEFNKKAVFNGYPAKKIRHKGLANFIRRYAENENYYSKTWTKNEKNEAISTFEKKEMTVDFAIQFLKSKGFKVLKPVNEFVEC